MYKTKKRRKKGVSTQERKQQLAAQKKYFLARLFDFGKKLGITDVLKLIPAREYATWCWIFLVVRCWCVLFISNPSKNTGRG